MTVADLKTMGTSEPRRLSFKIEGLDCQNEVRRLKAAVRPLVGGDDMLAFDTNAGLMDVTVAGHNVSVKQLPSPSQALS